MAKKDSDETKKEKIFSGTDIVYENELSMQINKFYIAIVYIFDFGAKINYFKVFEHFMNLYLENAVIFM